MAILINGPPGELQDTIKRARELLTLNTLTRRWSEHQLTRQFRVNITSIEGRADAVFRMMNHLRPKQAFDTFHNWLTTTNLMPRLQRAIKGLINPTALTMDDDEVR